MYEWYGDSRTARRAAISVFEPHWRLCEDRSAGRQLLARMDELPEAEIIRAVHPADVGGTKEVFKCYLAEPKIYTSEKGHASGRARAI